MPRMKHVTEHALHAAQLEWINPNTSGVYDYSMDADNAYYLMATSGFYPGEFGFFSSGSETTNWIGGHVPPHMVPLLQSYVDIK